MYDCIVVGSGIGGLTSAAILTQNNLKVLVLEANYLPGGCASSYPVKINHQTFWFETGATTLVGKDVHQPLYTLEKQLNILLPGEEIAPAMQVHINGKKITRFKDRKKWIQQCYAQFFKESEVSINNVAKFWEEMYDLGDFVWQVSGKNKFFPPLKPKDFLALIKVNKPSDAYRLRFMFLSLKQRMAHYKLGSNSEFISFCNEQLRITAQSDIENTSCLYAAPCLTYTNISNYYLYGGIIKLAEVLVEKLQTKGGEIRYRAKVISIEKEVGRYKVVTEKGQVFYSKNVISNATVWDMADLTKNRMRSYFQSLSEKYKFSWGAFTMGIALKKALNPEPPFHHQIHFSSAIENIASNSLFVSFSKPDDLNRHPKGCQAISISTHVNPELWLGFSDDYQEKKALAAEKILEELFKIYPEFKREDILLQHVSTPKSWQQWAHRKNGRVGGLPNTFSKIPIGVPQSRTPFKGLYLVGDTVFPGQGIAGVTLSGELAANHLLDENH